MPAGAPGDHWSTDLFIWGLPAFGEPCDSLLKDIVEYGGHEHLDMYSDLSATLGRLWPRWNPADQQALADLAARLTVLRDQLRRDAIAGGWEVD